MLVGLEEGGDLREMVDQLGPSPSILPHLLHNLIPNIRDKVIKPSNHAVFNHIYFMLKISSVLAFKMSLNIIEGFIQKRRQRSSLLLGEHNCFNSVPR